MLDEPIPKRCCLCLRCRTAVAPGMPCHCDTQEQVACFENPEERERIVAAVWGSARERKERQRLHERASRRVASQSIGGFAAAFGVSQALFGLSPASLLGGLLGSVGVGIVASRGNRELAVSPRGAEVSTESADTGLRATLEGEHLLVSPAGGHECLAYCVELRLIKGKREELVYRDAVTSGFRAFLGSGERVCVPAGPLHFESEAPEILDVDNPELAAYLHDIDPARPASELFDPLHYHLVREEVLFAGDRVDLTSTFEPVVERHEQALYRDSPTTYLAPRDVAALRLVR